MTSVEATLVALRARRISTTAAAAAVVTAMFALGLASSFRFLTEWEAWFLQVAARMRDGDVLYRDVAYGAGPLPAYMTEATTHLVGVDVLSVKLVVALAFAATGLLAWLVAERLGIGLAGRLLLLAALVYLAPPAQQPPYAPLAATFLLGALLAVLVARSDETRLVRTAAVLAAGAACALAFASKQNVGLLGLAAVLAVLVAARRSRDALLASGSFSLALALLLAPVWLSGGLAAYVDYGFTGKGEYVRAPATFGPALDGVVRTVTEIDSAVSADAAFWAVGFFLPFLAPAGLVGLVAAARRGRAPHALPVTAFAAASAATLLPRFDPVHVTYAAPGLVILLAYALHVWRPALPASVFAGLAAWVGIAALLTATLPLRLARSPDANLSELPHLRGSFVQQEDETSWRQEAARLVAAASGDSGGFLLLVPDAGFRYLTTGLRNPTPFDFPFVTTFGRDGQDRVVRQLASGRITRVCVAEAWFGLEPVRLTRWVRATMEPGARLGFCTVYTRPSA